MIPFRDFKEYYQIKYITSEIRKQRKYKQTSLFRFPIANMIRFFSYLTNYCDITPYMKNYSSIFDFCQWYHTTWVFASIYLSTGNCKIKTDYCRNIQIGDFLFNTWHCFDFMARHLYSMCYFIENLCCAILVLYNCLRDITYKH